MDCIISFTTTAVDRAWLQNKSGNHRTRKYGNRYTRRFREFEVEVGGTFKLIRLPSSGPGWVVLYYCFINFRVLPAPPQPFF